MTEPIRLAKRLAELVPCSRREAELYITGGWVRVDGQVVEEPQFMVSEQRVELHSDAALAPVEPVTIMFDTKLVIFGIGNAQFVDAFDDAPMLLINDVDTRIQVISPVQVCHNLPPVQRMFFM